MQNSIWPVLIMGIVTVVVSLILAGMWVYVTTPLSVPTYQAPTIYPAWWYYEPLEFMRPLKIHAPTKKRAIIKKPCVTHLGVDMEIKGLSASFKNAKKRISDARSATANFETSIGEFVASLDDVTKQIDAMHSDLKFEAETLSNSGNSVGASDNSPVGAKPSEGADLPKVG